MTSHPQSLRMYRKENNIEHAQQPALEVQLRLTKTGEDNNTFLSFNFDRGKDMGGPNKKKFEKEQSNLWKIFHIFHDFNLRLPRPREFSRSPYLDWFSKPCELWLQIETELVDFNWGFLTFWEFHNLVNFIFDSWYVFIGLATYNGNYDGTLQSVTFVKQFISVLYM